MPIASLTSKWQITIPKEVRKALNLTGKEKLMMSIEKDHAIISPIRGSLLDIGKSVTLPAREKPIDFKKTRKRVIKDVVLRNSERNK